MASCLYPTCLRWADIFKGDSAWKKAAKTTHKIVCPIPFCFYGEGHHNRMQFLLCKCISDWLINWLTSSVQNAYLIWRDLNFNITITLDLNFFIVFILKCVFEVTFSVTMMSSEKYADPIYQHLTIRSLWNIFLLQLTWKRLIQRESTIQRVGSESNFTWHELYDLQNRKKYHLWQQKLLSGKQNTLPPSYPNQIFLVC